MQRRSYLAIIFVAGFFVDLTDGPAFWVLMGVWFGSGVATLHPQSETLIARYVYRLRDLNQLEYQQIGPAWHTVCAAAGVSPNVFRVWIYDGQQITAPATTGHTIAVTTWSVYTLPAPLLRAVLAHELAHHLGTPPRWSVLVTWYSIPARIAADVIRRLMPVLGRFPLLKGLVIAFWVMVGAGLILHGRCTTLSSAVRHWCWRWLYVCHSCRRLGWPQEVGCEPLRCGCRRVCGNGRCLRGSSGASGGG